jgi:hypothetical protein
MPRRKPPELGAAWAVGVETAAGREAVAPAVVPVALEELGAAWVDWVEVLGLVVEVKGGALLVRVPLLTRLPALPELLLPPARAQASPARAKAQTRANRATNQVPSNRRFMGSLPPVNRSGLKHG